MLTNVEVPVANWSTPLVKAVIPLVNSGTLLFNFEVPSAKAVAPLVKAVLLSAICVKPFCKLSTPAV